MTDQSDLLAVLRQVHKLHVSLSEPLTSEQLRTDSFDPDWLVASLLSHMGSQAEILSLFITTSLNGEPTPGREAFESIWDRWNAMSPEDQRDSSIASTRSYVSLLEGLTDEQRDTVNIPFFGDIDGAELIRSLMNEYAMHVWDLDVTFNESATVHSNAVPILLTQSPKIAARYKHGGSPFTLQVQTTEPPNSYTAEFGETVTIAEGSTSSANVLQLPSEAFVRLVFGRLHPEHTPATTSIDGDVSLDDLRSIFVGF